MIKQLIINAFNAMTGKQLLAEYNARAKQAGKPELCERVKLSKTKLVERIEALPPVEPKPAKQRTIADFMREHGIDPVRGRAKLRAAGYSAPYDPDNAELQDFVRKLAGA